MTVANAFTHGNHSFFLLTVQNATSPVQWFGEFEPLDPEITQHVRSPFLRDPDDTGVISLPVRPGTPAAPVPPSVGVLGVVYQAARVLGPALPAQRSLEDYVQAFGHLKTARLIALAMMALTTVLLMVSGVENGWGSSSVQMFIVANSIFGLAIVCTLMRPSHWVLWWRFAAGVGIAVGVIAAISGIFLGLVQYAYGVIHATGLI